MWALPTTICWGFLIGFSALLGQAGPPSSKQPTIAPPPPKQGNVVPPPASPFRTKWSLSLPTAKRVTLAAGPTLFFVGMDAGPLGAYTLTDARPIWTADLKPDVPLVTGDGLVFVAEGESVHALDQSTGHEKWLAASGPLAVAPTWLAGWLFTATKDGTISAWRVSDGSLVWKQALGAAPATRIAIDGERLFVGLEDKRLVALRVLPDGEQQWTVKLTGVAGELLAAAGQVYFGTNDYGFLSIRQVDGKPEWPPHRVVHSTVVGHPVIDDERIWIATLNNRIAGLSRGNGEIEVMSTLPGRPSEQLAIDSGQVIVPLESGQLAIFDQKEGKPVLPAPPTPATPGAPPAPAVPPALPSSPILPTAPGTRLAAPLVPAGPADAQDFLRVTLAPDTTNTVTAFQRIAKSCALSFLPCYFSDVVSAKAAASR